MRPAFTQLNDAYFDLGTGGSDNRTFFTINKIRDTLNEVTTLAKKGIRSVVSVQLRLDSAVDTYNRQVYTIMGLLGDVGGI